MLLQVRLKRTVDSSLSSVRILLHQHYPSIPSEQTNSPMKERGQSKEQRHVDDEKDRDEDTSDSPVESEREEDKSTASESSKAEVTAHEAVSHTVNFLQPFLEEIHSENMSKV